MTAGALHRVHCERCDKWCYTKANAKKAAAALSRKQGRYMHPIGVYRCPHHSKLPKIAGHYHVGHVIWSRRR